MDIREATTADTEPIRSIARDSLSSSYTDFLDADTIEQAVDQWYDDDTLSDLTESDTALFLVVDDGDGPIAFSQSELVGDGTTIGHILWLHVHPDDRGGGTGVRLLVRTREELREIGAERIYGFVLEDNDQGNQFYADNGFERADTREVEVGDETYTETVFVESDSENLEWRGIEPHDVDDRTVYVSYGEAARGSEAPFYSAYESEDGARRYGWFCGNCDSVDNAMDAMGRIECNACGNRRKATRWDASYL